MEGDGGRRKRELAYPSVIKWCGDSAWSLVGLHVHFGVVSGAMYPGGIQLPCPVSHVLLSAIIDTCR